MNCANDYSKKWEQVLDILRSDMPVPTFRAWIEPLELIAAEEGEVAVRCSDPKALVERYQSRITFAVQAVFGEAHTLKIVRDDA